MSALSLMFLLACSEDSVDTGHVDDTGDTDTSDTDTSGTDDSGTDDTGTDPAEDEATLRAAIDGSTDAAEALSAIATSGGLPVLTAEGSYLFACLCGTGDWSLAGDHDDWAGAAMSRTGAMSWIEVDVPAPDGSLYKFTDGTDWIPDPLGRRYGYDDFGIHSIVRASAAHLERWYDISSSALSGRDLHVWVPQDGSFSHTLYVQDGQNLFDPEAIWGGWRLQESLPDDMLVVGIENTWDRISEYTHTTDYLHDTTYGGLGAEYAALQEETIRPLMESAYGEAATVGVMGSSLGGLISLYIAHTYPERYDFTASLSGTVGWGSLGLSNPTVIELMQSAGHQAPAVYIDSGGSGTCLDSDGDGTDDDGTDSDNYCVNLQLRDVLSGIGYTFDVDLWHWHEEDAPHNEYAWSERVFRPLEVFESL